MSDDIRCPRCGNWDEVCHDDGQGYCEDSLHEQECSQCGEVIQFYTHISFSYWPGDGSMNWDRYGEEFRAAQGLEEGDA